jgi:hypothetical protein
MERSVSTPAAEAVRAAERFDAHSRRHLTGPRPAVGRFPYPHRTVAEVWEREVQLSVRQQGQRT